MADCLWKPPSQCAKKKTGRKVLETPADPNHSLIERGSRMADYSPYNSRDCGDSPEKSANWKLTGDLAAELVRKAGSK